MRSSSRARAKVLRGAAVSPLRLESMGDVVDRSHHPEFAAQANGTGGSHSREEAYRNGYEAGRLNALAEQASRQNEAVVRLLRAADALKAAVAELALAREKAVTVAEDEIGSLAFEIAEAILQRELELSASPGREAVARALRLVPPQVEVTVRLHPDDVDVVVAELAAEGGIVDGVGVDDEGRRISFVPDEAIQPGGCVAEAGACRVDAQLSTALSRVKRSLNGGHAG